MNYKVIFPPLLITPTEDILCYGFSPILCWYDFDDHLSFQVCTPLKRGSSAPSHIILAVPHSGRYCGDDKPSEQKRGLGRVFSEKFRQENEINWRNSRLDG